MAMDFGGLIEPREVEYDPADGEADKTEASLPRDIKMVGNYTIFKTTTGDFTIQHHYLPSNVWIDGRDIDAIIEAIQELRSDK